MVVSFNKIFNSNPVRFKSAQKTNPVINQGIQQDTFTPSPEMITRKKFDALFPNGEINRIYDVINKDFQIDNPAKLNFEYDKNSKLGGGYTFDTNTIDMNMYDLIDSDKKIVGIKDGKKYPLVNPKDKLPLYVNEDLANLFVDKQNQKGSFGFEKLIIEDVTPAEQKKFVLHKIAHECVHAKQHQILRETEGIGDKEIIKAWTHAKPKNLIEEKSLNEFVEKRYSNSPWAKTPKPQIKYKKDSPTYQKAIILLDAIQNYPPVDSPLYTQNALEREAFDVSAQYVQMKRF